MKAKAITEGKVHGPGAKQQQMELAGLVEYEPFDFPDGKAQKEYGGTSEQWTQFIGAFAIALPTTIAHASCMVYIHMLLRQKVGIL